MRPEQPRPTILVVDDNEVTREGIAVVLRRGGYVVVTAADGAQALDSLRAGPPPALILLDMLMPLVDGWQFLDRLRKGRAPHPPVIVTSGSVVRDEWALAHGCAGFLPKPVDAEDLLREVRRVLG